MGDTKVSEIQVPDWLDEPFITKSLRRGTKNNDLIISEYNIAAATGKGDNYLSQMMRVTLRVNDKEGDEKPLSVIVKSFPLGDTTQQMIKDRNIFGKERYMYERILPQMAKVLREVFPGEESFNAFLYDSQDPPNDAIVMQDLKTEGFAVEDRMKGLDEAHSEVVFRNLAKFHAASLLLLDQPGVRETYDECGWNPKLDKGFEKFIKTSVASFAKQVKEWEDIPNHMEYYRKLTELEPVSGDKLEEVVRRDDAKLNTLVHGDCWCNNLMFRHSEGTAVTLKLVDFQICNINSPLLDLVYFVFTSVRDDLKLSRLDHFLKIYQKTFLETTTALNIDLKHSLTFEELKKAFLDKLYFGLFSVIFVLPIVLVPKDKAPDMDSALNEDSDYSNETMLDNPTFKRIVSQVLPFFDAHGVL